MRLLAYCITASSETWIATALFDDAKTANSSSLLKKFTGWFITISIEQKIKNIKNAVNTANPVV
ncbi:hypothetical protein MuYL_0174 [Mucilaginibacter xinganensis]|uniref:Uncharacterized protein n=1 Tax=Mucilaginibacter xinganensis TaxID=1234841 RepID=A0A223NQG6_9SPHI|nr:hypothetical protein MuYL_0174 [Mucilaginibacter xinganensis]